MLWAVTSGIPFRALENEHFHNLLRTLNAAAPNISRKRLAGALLEDRAAIIQRKENDLIQTATYLNLCADGWTNGRHRSVLVFSVITDKFQQICPFKTVDWTGQSHTAHALEFRIEDAILELGENGHKVVNIILDGSGESPDKIKLKEKS